MLAPIIRLMVGVADQKYQSMANAQRMAVYSKGPTTEAGARLKASVTHNCASDPLTPTAASQTQSSLNSGRQSCKDSSPDPPPASTSNQNTMARVELRRPSARTVRPLTA